MEQLKIVTPVGMLGYGYSTELLYQGLAEGASVIIVDAGSTDSGPQKLALGESTCPYESYVQDMGPMLDACWHHKVKILISSAGGDGSNEHVDELVDIIRIYSEKQKYKFNVVYIYSEIEKDVVERSFDHGKISPCGAAPTLEKVEISKATKIVAQMGMEPFLAAIEKYPNYDIIIAGRSYDPSPYAAYCYSKGFKNLGNIYHMGKIMECGALCSLPKSKEALATIWQDKFEICALSPSSKCTTQSLAAHTLYEKSRPDLLPGPGGILDVSSATYQENGSRCFGTGAKFYPSKVYTVKLEGAKPTGYRTVVMGSIRDPILIPQIDVFLQNVKTHVLSQREEEGCDLIFHVYGQHSDDVTETKESVLKQEIAILVEAKAPSQNLATIIASSARIALLHAPYANQKATAGNFAIPLNPLEIPLGHTSEFNIYHLMEIDDPIALFPNFHKVVGVSETVSRVDQVQVQKSPEELIGEPRNKVQKSLNKFSTIQSLEDRIPCRDGKVYLHSLAKIIRSKNAGPFEITFDIIFHDDKSLNQAKKSGQLTAEKLAALYNVNPENVIACMYFEQANAFKFTIPRWAPSGGFGEIDVHASQQHVPLMFVEI
ncbi:hypothetical protein NQZ79_g661 [Umbelopsis isabellina]|nr:hypothetical protein NQZ79_g661 [Umbelopsis isabellina]